MKSPRPFHQTLALAIVSVVLLFLSPGARSEGQEPAAKAKAVTPDQLEKLVIAKPEVVILDVRTPAERSSGRLAHSINVDARSSDFREQLAKLDRSKPYVVHCVHGLKRTSDTVSVLSGLGFTNVSTLIGGYDAWVKAGKPVEK